MRIYTRTLDPREAAELSGGTADMNDFDGANMEVSPASQAYIADTSMYMGERKLTALTQLETVSPDGDIRVQLWSDEDGRLYYSVTAGDTVIIESSRLGLELAEGELSQGLVPVGDAVTTHIDESYQLFTGADRTAVNLCNETRVTLRNDNGSFELAVRAYGDGVAYRYEKVSIDGKSVLTVTDELSEVIFQPSAQVWSFDIIGTYEGEYIRRSGKQLESLTGKQSTPMMIHQGEYWAVLTEASVFNNNGDFCSSALATAPGTRAFHWEFGLARDPRNEARNDIESPGHIAIEKVSTRNGFSTPWRTLIVSDDLDALCTSDLIPNLNPAADPGLYSDLSYIKPGRVAWSWWAEDAEQGNYDKHIEYIDFAAQNGWEYVCLDVGWRAFEDRLGEICSYAAEKGVGIFVWINYRDMTTPEEMETLFARWSTAGAVGLKTDYFESDEQHVLDAMGNAAVCAAKNRMMILYHGCVRPAGECRTYPNILSTEAVQGEEWHKWFAYPTIENCLIYPFSRNVCGAMDYTPVATKVGSNEASFGFGLAMTVVYESGLQHLAYAASAYRSYAGLSFLNNLSVSWDESRLTEGYPGEYVTYVRRSGERWYIGSMTKDARTAEVSLDFLGDGEYNAYIYRDSEDGSQLVIDEQRVSKDDTLTLTLAAAGGAAVLITRETVDTTVHQSA